MHAIGFIADMGAEVVFGRGLIALYDPASRRDK